MHVESVLLPVFIDSLNSHLLRCAHGKCRKQAGNLTGAGAGYEAEIQMAAWREVWPCDGSGYCAIVVPAGGT